MIKFDPRVTIAVILALILQTAGALMWAGRAAARLDAVERAVATQPEVAERLARLEEQVGEARRSLTRIERRLDE
jgi:type VI protein secretion system component VasK